MSGLFDLTGKTALITGAWRGIGFALAGGLAEAGANIVLNGQPDYCGCHHRGSGRSDAAGRKRRG